MKEEIRVYLEPPSARSIIMGAKVQTYLEERSKLIFQFYKGNSPHPIVRVLDFWENIRIKESQKPNIITYNPISRAGSLYSYAGAKSRMFNLSFNITLPNIISASNRRQLTDKNKYNTGQFFKDSVATDTPSDGFPQAIVADYDSEFARMLDNYDPENFKLLYNTDKGKDVQSWDDDVLDSDGNPTGEKTLTYDAIDFTKRPETIGLVMWWVNLVRSSVLNDSQNPLNGPPIVRLKHGILYQDIPCICTGYGVSYDERGGYDLETLLPRVINITMKLEEYRNAGKFSYQTAIERDSLTGWESIINGPFTADPGEPKMGQVNIGEKDFELL
jgi:hypothetical protein